MKTTANATYSSASHEHDRSLIDIRLSKFLTRWRERLGYMSMWALIPVLAGAEATETQANNVLEPSENVTELKAGYARDRVQNRPRSEFLQRLREYSRSQRAPTLAQSGLAGNGDDCPGKPIPAGTYTSAAPYTENGTTVGANNTINDVCNGYYCYYAQGMPGPDVVYRLNISTLGKAPMISVESTTEGFEPSVYLLDSFWSGGCPSGTMNFGYDWWWLRGTRSVWLDQADLRNRPVYVFVDSTTASGGGYTLKLQDVTLAEAKWPAVVSDFDGDMRSDSAVFRPSEGKWHLRLPGNTVQTHSWGLATDKITPADFDGDGVMDMAVYRPSEGQWYIVNSSNSTINVVPFGLNGDVPQPQDFDGDFKADFGLFRPSDSKWYIGLSGSGNMYVQQWGLPGDKPVASDYSGDRKAELAVYRPSEGQWYTFNLANGTIIAQAWGLADDKPVPSDYDGDLKSDFAVFRPSNRKWYRINSTNFAVVETEFGGIGAVPVPGDFDGDGLTNLAVFSPSAGQWSAHWWCCGIMTWSFGAEGDLPAANAFVY